jgi:hypothetical protein
MLSRSQSLHFCHNGQLLRIGFGAVFLDSRRSSSIRLTHDSEASNRVATAALFYQPLSELGIWELIEKIE